MRTLRHKHKKKNTLERDHPTGHYTISRCLVLDSESMLFVLNFSYNDQLLVLGPGGLGFFFCALKVTIPFTFGGPRKPNHQ